MPLPLKLENQKFGKLTVIKRVENNANNDSCWLCKCDCGNTRTLTSHYLKKKGFELHCGATHHKGINHGKNITGKTIGHLTAIRFVKYENNQNLWEFKCKCGKNIIRPANSVSRYQTSSCGCYFKKTRKELSDKLRQWHKDPSNYEKWHQIRQKATKFGTESPMWDHSKSMEDRYLERYERKLIPGYKQWRKSVYERDNWTCRKCKEKSGKLRAHHIKPYTLFKECRTEVSNGITLCEKCHIAYHKQYGSKENCNQETLDFFLRS